MPVTTNSSTPRYGAGSTLEVNLTWDGQADLSTLTDWATLYGLAEIPQIGDEVEEEEDTEIHETARRYSNNKLATPTEGTPVAAARPRPAPTALQELHTLQALNHLRALATQHKQPENQGSQHIENRGQGTGLNTQLNQGKQL